MALWRAGPLGGWSSPQCDGRVALGGGHGRMPPSVLPHRTGVRLRKPRSGGSWKGLQLAVFTPAENTAVCVQRGKWVMSSLPQVWTPCGNRISHPQGLWEVSVQGGVLPEAYLAQVGGNSLTRPPLLCGPRDHPGVPSFSRKTQSSWKPLHSGLWFLPGKGDRCELAHRLSRENPDTLGRQDRCPPSTAL